MDVDEFLQMVRTTKLATLREGLVRLKQEKPDAFLDFTNLWLFLTVPPAPAPKKKK